MMNQEIKDKWVAALRSGNYEQGRKTLRSKDEKFCCLGVLCDQQRPDLWRKTRAGTYRHGSRVLEPQTKFLKECELPKYKSEYLAWKNDSGYSFVDIADWIEQNL